MKLGMYRLALDLILKDLRAQLLPVMRVADWNTPDGAAKAVPEVAAIVRDARVKAAEKAGEFMAAQAKEQAGASAFVPAPEGYPDEAVAQVFRQSRSEDEVLASFERHVETAARRQVVRSVPAAEDESGLPGFEDMFEGVEEHVEAFGKSKQPWDELAKFVPHVVEDHKDAAKGVKEKKPVFPEGWARVPTGAETCPFCFMLASRGPVYSSYSHAIRPAAKVKAQYQSERRAHTRSSRSKYTNTMPTMVLGAEQSYHDHCDCIVVPVYNREADWPGKEQYLALEDRWKDLAKSLGTAPSFKNWRDHLKDSPIELPDIRKAA